MAYCTNCGKEIPSDSNFCAACGTENAEYNSGKSDETRKSIIFPKDDIAKDSTKREQEYVGTIIKCPACGEELSSFTAICPSCGHEMNSVKISPILLAFSEKIELYDKEIASKTEINTGWKTWGKTARILWIIANVISLGLLAVAMYGVSYIVSFSKHPKLSPVEKKKTALIENLSIPNEREAILEVLLFIKAKVSFLSSGKNDSCTAYWLRIWGTKAEQIFDKAKILLGEDAIAIQSYSYIKQQIERSRKNTRFKIVTTVIILILYFLVVLAIHPVGSELIRRSGIELPEPPEYIGSVVETHEAKDYCGKNLASCGKFSTFYREYQDSYGNGYVKLSIVTEDGIYIAPDDIDTMEQYVVAQQSVQPDTIITFQFAKEKDGDYGRTTQMYRSFDEIVLFVKKRTESTRRFDAKPHVISVKESPNENTYFVRDYTGRNLASCGSYSSFYGDFRDDYGAGQIILNIICDDGTYIHPERIEQLREYVITGQGISPNTEVQFTFDDYLPSSWSFVGSSIDSIDIYVTRLDEQIILDAYQQLFNSETTIENTNEE